MTMIEEKLPAPRPPHQRALVPLKSGALACRNCGVAVFGATPEKLASYGQVVRVGPTQLVQHRDLEFTMATCDDCAATRMRAEAIVAEHPRVFRRMGSPRYSADLVETALLGLDAIGIRPDRADQLAATDAGVKLVTKHLGPVSAAVTWAARFAPLRNLDADPATCAPKRWTHVTGAEQQELRRAYAAMLRERTERPVPIAPPDDGVRGCITCGVGSVMEVPSKRDEVWGQRHRVSAFVMGGRGTDAVLGYLCPACRAAFKHTGSFGPTLLEIAVLTHLGLDKEPYAEVEMGLRAWSALPPGTPPNATPWQHVPDLMQLEDRLKEAWEHRFDPRREI